MSTLRDAHEEEVEGDEDSPLRQDFDNFASFEPSSPKNSFSPQFRMDSYGENSKTLNCHDMNCSNVPLKAGFDDFDGVSPDSITPGGDTLSLPFPEESLRSVRSSPIFINEKVTLRSNLSQLSMSNKSGSPKNSGKRRFLSSPNSAKLTVPDYENGSPESLSTVEKTVPLRIDFPAIDAIDIDNGIGDSISTVDYVNKSETLNNGYIGGATT